MPRGTGHSPANVAQNLAGIDFPCSKQQIVDYAEQQGAEQAVLEELHKLPERQYTNMADVMKGYGEVE